MTTEALIKDDEIRPSPGEFTEPMQAFLLSLAAQSPFPLAPIWYERSAHSSDTGVKPSRLAVLLGEDAEYDAEKNEFRNDLADLICKIRQNLKWSLRSARDTTRERAWRSSPLRILSSSPKLVISSEPASSSADDEDDDDEDD